MYFVLRSHRVRIPESPQLRCGSLQLKHDKCFDHVLSLVVALFFLACCAEAPRKLLYATVWAEAPLMFYLAMEGLLFEEVRGKGDQFTWVEVFPNRAFRTTSEKREKGRQEKQGELSAEACQ